MEFEESRNYLNENPVELPATNPIELLSAFEAFQSEHLRAMSIAASHMGITAVELRAIVAIGSHEDCTPKELAQRMRLTSGGLTNLLDRLEDAGYIVRQANPHDRRSSLLVLTAEGVDVRDGFTREYAAAITQSLHPDRYDHIRTFFVEASEGLRGSFEERK